MKDNASSPLPWHGIDGLFWVQNVFVAAAVVFAFLAWMSMPKPAPRLERADPSSGPVAWGNYPVDWRLVPSPGPGLVYIELSTIKAGAESFDLWYQFENAPPVIDDSGELVWIVNTYASFSCQSRVFARHRVFVWGPDRRISERSLPFVFERVPPGSREESISRALCGGKTDLTSLKPRDRK